MDINAYLEKARYSKFNLWILNTLLLRVVPFNKPHNIRVLEIGDDFITVKAKHKRNNLNHVGGMHACLLATLCEYASGLGLLRNLNPNEYRLLMRSLSMTYHQQAKEEVFATFSINQEMMDKHILDPLSQQESIFREFIVEAYTRDKTSICTAKINWQIKSWKAVRKVS